ncbi:hypothetical protein J7E49_10750 [Variovorax paradoxus]|nr:hypothetical protein [Variovorax paradoxus]
MTNAELLQRAAEYQAKHGRDEALALCMEILEQCMRIEQRMAADTAAWRARQAETTQRQIPEDGSF